MRDKRKEPLRLEGKTVILEEIAPKYFPYVVEWRNNKDNNRFINQPFVLTEEKERDWYENVYLDDDTQGLMILIDRETDTPFGTLGWTHLDRAKKICVQGRLMVGNHEFRSSIHLIDAQFVLADYLHSFIDITYGHVVTKNRKVISLTKRCGFAENLGTIVYPSECHVNGMELTEFFRTEDMNAAAKRKLRRFFPELFSTKTKIT